MNKKIFVWVLFFVLFSYGVLAVNYYSENLTTSFTNGANTEGEYIGVRFRVLFNVTLLNTTCYNGNTLKPDSVRLYDASKSTLFTNSTLSGSYEAGINYNLTAGVDYYLGCTKLGSGGSTNWGGFVNPPNLNNPIVTGVVNWTRGFYVNGANVDEYQRGIIRIGLRNGTEDAPYSPSITFISQTPTNITSISIFESSVKIRYNFTNINLSTALLNYSLVSSTLSCLNFINGSCVLSNNTISLVSGVNITATNYSDFNYTLSENDVYPSINNINYTYYNATHTDYSLSNINTLILQQFNNVSNLTQYNVFEVMANSSGSLRVYACNSSYDLSSNIGTSPYCQIIGNIDTQTFNHSHNTYSKHNIVPYTVINGKISGTGISISPSMYFVLRQTTGTSQAYYVSGVGRAGFLRTSINVGSTFSNVSGTLDSHLHTFTNTEYLLYKACGTYTSFSGICSSSVTEYINVVDLDPAPPLVNAPNSSNYFYGTSLFINYTASTGFVTNLSYYNITLLNSTFGFNKTIIGNNSLNTNYTFLITNVTPGSYYVKVEVTDLFNLTSYGLSELFNITAYVNISVRDAFSGANLTNFTGWVYNHALGTNVSFNSTSQFYQAPIILGNNTIYVESGNYSITSNNLYNYNFTAPENTYQFSLYTKNSVYCYIYDEATSLFITENVTVLFTGPLGDTTYSTVTGRLYVDFLVDGNYTIKAQASNYSLRTYNIVVGNYSTQSLNIFLTASTSTVILTYLDSGTAGALEGVSVSQYRLINGSWTLLQTKSSDITGRLQFTFIPNVKYRFYSTFTGYSDKTFDLDPIIFTSYNVLLNRLSTGLNITSDLTGISVQFSPSKYYRGENNNFSFEIQAYPGILTYYYYNLSGCFGSTAWNGTNTIGDIDLYNITLNCGGLFDRIRLDYGYRSIYGDNNYTTYFSIIPPASFNHTLMSNKNNTYGLGLFDRIVIVTIIILVLAGVTGLVTGSSTAGLMIGAFTLVFFVAIGMIPGWVAYISIIMAVIIILYSINART